MNATDSLAVVKARLPYTDRGSFSQAWFSALRLAGDAPGARDLPRVHRPLDAGARIASDARDATSNDVKLSRAATVAAPRANAGRSATRGWELARSRPASKPPSSLRAKSAPAAAEAAPFRATLSAGNGSARVQLLMRREGATVVVVALCSARNVELVQRALADARRSLRAAGQAMEGTVRAIEGGER